MRMIATSLVAATLWGCAGANEQQYEASVSALERVERGRAITEQHAAGLTLGAVLDRAALVRAVLARNPDLEAARQAWRAAIAAYPSATSLEDPMASYDLAPFSIGSSAVPYGQRIDLSQKLPWPGKLADAGDAAIADADASEADYGALQLVLAEATVDAFDDDYVAARGLAINAHHHRLMERIEKSATAQYTVGHASQQDPIEAHARIIALDRERLTLETRQRIATARINRLLHRPDDAALPPPPDTLAVPPPDAAVGAHPLEVAARARVRARAADVDRTDLAFYPDFTIMGSYNSMWSTWQHRWMVGVGINIPIERARRHADVDRARAAQARAEAELVSVDDQLAEARTDARREVDEATQAVALYEQRYLPTARERVDAALAGFTAGQNPFTTVVLAEHELRDIELALEEARAELDRRTAALDRALGRIPGLPPGEAAPVSAEATGGGR